MRVPVPWLREFVEGYATMQATARALTSRGFAVESMEQQPMPGSIVIGSIERLERHPDADRLQVGQVNTGAQMLQIVTGADNVAVGDRVPVALEGAVVMSGVASNDGSRQTKAIRKSKLRGVESDGMMCSAVELALPGEFEDGILIMEPEAEIGEDFWRVARFGEGIFDVEVPSNRPDCLSIIGLAREAAAGLRARFHEPDLPVYAGQEPSSISVEIQDPSICRQLLGQHFAGVKNSTSPMWMRLRLHAAGMRSHNFLIDVSNYVQLETGQPLHFYDAARVRGAKIVARGAAAGETVVTLDGIQRGLLPGTPVIADESGVIGIAGILGGAACAVSETTTELFLESPTFAGTPVRRAAIQLGLRTEGASRHERNLPPELAELGRRRASQMLGERGTVASAVARAGDQSSSKRVIALRPRRANALLGTCYTPEQMIGALTPIGINVVGESVREGRESDAPAAGDASISVQAPWWRTDLIEEVDIVEEIARALGYETIPEMRAAASPQDIDEGAFTQETYAARRLAAFGYVEVVNLALLGTRVLAEWERSGLGLWPQMVRIVNPLSDEQRLLRPSLLPGLLSAASRRFESSARRCAIFEIGHVFVSGNEGMAERQMLAGLTVRAHDDEGALDRGLLELKGDAQALVGELCGRRPAANAAAEFYFHPGAGGVLSVAGEQTASFGRLHPRLTRALGLPAATFYFEVFLERLPRRRPIAAFEPLPRFPGTRRDLAVIVDQGVNAGALIETVRDAQLDALEDVTAFDEYRGSQVLAGKKSVALSLNLRLPDATITDAQGDAVVRAVLELLQRRFAAVIRGPAANAN